MFERESGYSSRIENAPSEVIVSFNQSETNIAAKSMLSWAEHCSECAMPACFQSCSFYQPREDLKCRRFPGGFEEIKLVADAISSKKLVKVKFSKWAKLEAPGSNKVYKRLANRFFETTDRMISKSLTRVYMPFSLRLYLRRKYYGLKKKLLTRASHKHPPEEFLIEAYSPGKSELPVKLSFYDHTDNRKPPYEKLINLQPGYNLNKTSYIEINQRIPLSKPFDVKIEVMSRQDSIIYFGIIDFVQLSNQTREVFTANKNSTKKIKCVVWDLDNTLWDGILVEDGIENLKLNNEAIDVIRELESRGILNTIASKNNYDEAINALKFFELEKYFILKEISWEPKSQSVNKIRTILNIGIDTFAFVDDQKFERSEVKNTHPDIEVFTENEISSITTHERFDVVITADSKNRKKMYLDEINRKEYQQSSQSDYDMFLKDCKITLTVTLLDETSLERAYELAQRTNQMNFSGNRYSIKELSSFIDSEDHIIMTINASDKFGEYGTVGLAIYNKTTNTVNDLMFSCRIQAKKVDHAFLSLIIKKYSADNNPVKIEYRESEKNKVAAKIFSELGFKEVAREEELITYVYPLSSPIPENDIIKISDKT